MITIKAKDTKVVIEVEGKYPLKLNYLFYWECNRDDYASLLAENLDKRMRQDLETIRRESYDKGWKDAKAKKTAKDTWFKSLW